MEKDIRRIVFCGFDCHECLVYKATIKDDLEYKEEVRKKYSSDNYHLNIEDINCTGCYKDSKFLFKFCADCEIRICGLSKGINNCGECGIYPCSKLDKAFEIDIKNKINLDYCKLNKK